MLSLAEKFYIEKHFTIKQTEPYNYFRPSCKSKKKYDLIAWHYWCIIKQGLQFLSKCTSTLFMISIS